MGQAPMFVPIGRRTPEWEAYRGDNNAHAKLAENPTDLLVLAAYARTLDQEADDTEAGDAASVAYMTAYRAVILEEMTKRGLTPDDWPRLWEAEIERHMPTGPRPQSLAGLRKTRTLQGPPESQ